MNKIERHTVLNTGTPDIDSILTALTLLENHYSVEARIYQDTVLQVIFVKLSRIESMY